MGPGGSSVFARHRGLFSCVVSRVMKAEELPWHPVLWRLHSFSWGRHQGAYQKGKRAAIEHMIRFEASLSLRKSLGGLEMKIARLQKSNPIRKGDRE